MHPITTVHYLVLSAALLLIGTVGVLTRRKPTEAELKDIDYGRRVARHLAHYDIGQTVVIAEAACVAQNRTLTWRAHSCVPRRASTRRLFV